MSRDSWQMGCEREPADIRQAPTRRVALAAEAAVALTEVGRLTGPRAGALFERWLEALFGALGHTVRRVGGPRDRGADLFLDLPETSVVVQAKYSATRAIDGAAVAEVHLARTYYHAGGALVVSNQEFTAEAIARAAACGVELWGRRRLWEEMLHAPWIPAVPSESELFPSPIRAMAGLEMPCPSGEGPATFAGRGGADARGRGGFPTRLARALLWRFTLIGVGIAAAVVDLALLPAAVATLIGGCVLLGVWQGQDVAAPIWRTGAGGVALGLSAAFAAPPILVVALLACVAGDALIVAGKPWWAAVQRRRWPLRREEVGQVPMPSAAEAA